MDDAKLEQIKNEYIKKTDEVNYDTKLPEAEFDVMLAIWQETPPVTTNNLMRLLGDKKSWQKPTLVSFLVRLEERGFVISYKIGKERYYIPTAEHDAYLSRITDNFVKKYHGGSLTSLLDSLYREKDFTPSELDAFLKWLTKKK